MLDKNKKIPTRISVFVLGGFFVVILIVVMASFGGNNSVSESTPANTKQSRQETNAEIPLAGIKVDSITTVSSNATARYRGATYTVEKFTADGRNTIFLLRDSYDDITVRVNNRIIAIGTYRDGLPCSSEACYDFAGKNSYFLIRPPRELQ